jgi:uncharacterized membrane protein (UPF0127 family)
MASFWRLKTTMKARILNKNILLAETVEIADSFIKRFKGLMGSSYLEEGVGLLIIPCKSIHTWFMKYPIDVVFLDKKNVIVEILHSVPPYRIGPIVKKAFSALELKAGTCCILGITTGDRVEYI